MPANPTDPIPGAGAPRPVRPAPESDGPVARSERRPAPTGRTRADPASLAPSDAAFRSPAWVISFGRRIDRLGPMRAVGLLAAIVVLGSLAIGRPFLATYPPVVQFHGTWITIVVAAAISTPVLFVLCRVLTEVSRSRVALHKLAHVDELTRAATRRHFLAAAPQRLARCEVFAIVLLDVDDFKQINDRHGHPVGDQVLRAVSDACRDVLAGGQLFARHGGEEFIALLPGSRIVAAVGIAERLRRAVAAVSLHTPDGHRLAVTASLGVSVRRLAGRPSPSAALDTAIIGADAALYQAKRDGKNRVAIDGASAAASSPPGTRDAMRVEASQAASSAGRAGPRRLRLDVGVGAGELEDRIGKRVAVRSADQMDDHLRDDAAGPGPGRRPAAARRADAALSRRSARLAADPIRSLQSPAWVLALEDFVVRPVACQPRPALPSCRQPDPCC